MNLIVRVRGIVGVLGVFALMTVVPSISWADCKGTKTSRSYETETVHSLFVSGDADVFITQGNPSTLRIEARDGVLEDLDVSVTSGRVKIAPDDCDDHAYTVHVTMTDMRALEFRGSTRVAGVTALEAVELALATSGSSDVRLEVAAEHLLIVSSGSADLDLSGRSEKVSVKMSGSSDLEAENLLAEEYEIDASGSSKLFIHVTNRLEAELSGSTRIDYLGSPRVDIEASGSSRVKAR